MSVLEGIPFIDSREYINSTFSSEVRSSSARYCRSFSRVSVIYYLLYWFSNCKPQLVRIVAVSYTHLRAHETRHDLVCRLLLEKKKTKKKKKKQKYKKTK